MNEIWNLSKQNQQTLPTKPDMNENSKKQTDREIKKKEPRASQLNTDAAAPHKKTMLPQRRLTKIIRVFYRFQLLCD